MKLALMFKFFDPLKNAGKLKKIYIYILLILEGGGGGGGERQGERQRETSINCLPHTPCIFWCTG